jgi:hypothetical protein
MTAFMSAEYAAIFEIQQQIIQYECDEGQIDWVGVEVGVRGLLIAWY